MSYQTEQELFWAGEFGDQYIARNTGEDRVAADTALFARVVARMQPVRSIIEFGANIGLNLRALKHLCPRAELAGVEINTKAADELEQIGGVTVFRSSILDFQPSRTYDLAFIKGVLIHINPERLGDVYQRLYDSSSRYLCVVEYYNPTPVEVTYRGHEQRLFKRDFAGEIMDRFPDVRLVDYGFVYHRDPVFPEDDFTWFLMEKREPAPAGAGPRG